MRALTRLEIATLLESSKDQSAKRSPVSIRRKLIVGLYLVAAPVVSIAWVAGLTWAAIRAVRYALS